MTYAFDFSGFGIYAGMLARGVAVTLGLTAVSTVLGVDESAWVADTVTLTLYTSAYLSDIWRGCVEAVPRGQWAAGASLGITFGQQLRYIVWP
jgi:ABC-type amino acid transport system permease subunit